MDDAVCERCGWPIQPGELVVIARPRPAQQSFAVAGWPLAPLATFHKRHWADADPLWAKLDTGYAQRPQPA